MLQDFAKEDLTQLNRIISKGDIIDEIDILGDVYGKAKKFLSNGYIDNVMVSPQYQGKGYGKKTTQFAINKALSKDFKPIYLCYLDENEKADRLYKSLGFQTMQIVHVYRKYMEEQS